MTIKRSPIHDFIRYINAYEKYIGMITESKEWEKICKRYKKYENEYSNQQFNKGAKKLIKNDKRKHYKNS